MLLQAPAVLPPTPKSPNIGYIRQEVAAMSAKWELVEDCLAGQDAIKSKGSLYLPKPNSADESPENAERYSSYIMRAVFYNVTRKTLDGLVGQVFSRDPLVGMPDLMRTQMLNDIDGNGVTLDQQAKKGLGYVIGFGRFGILVDYPKLDRAISVAEQQAGFFKPTLLQYAPRSIINWRTIQKGGKSFLSLLVLVEDATTSDDGFEITSEQHYRVLELINGECVMSVWRYVAKDETYVIESEKVILKDASGKPLQTIPFYFCGVLNNDNVIDLPPIYDLATLNIAHYRNSADYEDSCYMVGQPTPFFSGLSQQWVDKVFKNKAIQLGSRAAIPLPVGGTAGLLQANPNTLPFEAMGQKERQMMALGAKLIEGGSGTNTLGQAQLNESSETSTLATAAKNVAMCYTEALKMAAKLFGVTGDISYSLNTDFPASRLTPNERAQLVLEWQSGAITESEMRAGLRKAGVATLDEVDYKSELKKSPPPVQQAMTNNQGQGGSDNKPEQNEDTQNNGGNQAGV